MLPRYTCGHDERKKGRKNERHTGSGVEQGRLRGAGVSIFSYVKKCIDV